MPKKYNDCVKKVSKTVKPRSGETKEQAAHAICTKQLGKHSANKNIKRGKK